MRLTSTVDSLCTDRRGVHSVTQRRVAELVADLKECSKSRDLKRGQYVHRQVIESGLNSNLAVLNTLVNMYSKCGNLRLAIELFENMDRKDKVTWNCLIMGYVENAQYFQALELFNRMDCCPSPVTYVAALKACIGLATGKASMTEKMAALERGKALHEELRERSFEMNIFVASTLVIMYSKCGSMPLAKDVFDGMEEKDAATWNSLILGYVDNGEHDRALEVFCSMSCEPSEVSFVAAVKACRGLASDVNSSSNSSTEQHATVLKGCLALHKSIRSHGYDTNLHVTNILIDMYGKCRRMDLARSTFEQMAHKSVVTWNSLMQGYVENGEHEVALALFSCMDCEPDDLTYVAALKACVSMASKRDSDRGTILKRAMAIQRKARREFGPKASSTLVELCGKCGNMELAKQIFEKMKRRDVVAWNCLAQGYVENEEYLQALNLLETMDCEHSQASYVIQLKACIGLAHKKGSKKEIILGRIESIRNRVAKKRLETNSAVASALLEVYVKCRDMRLARDVFERMVDKNVVHWTSLILGYVVNGDPSTALDLFSNMDCDPDEVAFLAAIKACSDLAHKGTIAEAEKVREKCVQVHEQIKANGFESSVVVLNALIDMYRKLGDMKTARQVFEVMQMKSVVSWNSLVLGYVENGEYLVALDLFRCMDCEPTDVTIVVVLKAYGSLAGERSGDSEREEILEKSLQICEQLEKQEITVSNALLNVCSKCRSMTRARQVFDTMENKDVVSWNCLILGYAENGESLEALDMFSCIDCEPDDATFVALLEACESLAAVSTGRTVHGMVCKLGLEDEGMVANKLVDFYSRCGCMLSAVVLFNGLHSPNIVSWNSLLTGYSSLGDSSQVFSLTKMIIEANLQLNAISFVCILTICSRRAMVEEGRRWFETMQKLEIPKSVEHYNCMVDMFARANRFDEALLTIQNMPLKANEVTWMSLLGASRKWSNMEVSKLALDALVQNLEVWRREEIM